MASKKVDVTIGIKNKTVAGLKTVKAGIKRFSQSVTRSMRSMGISFRRVATVGVASFIALIKYGNAFRASMAEVKTMLGDDKSALPELTRQVRELSGAFGLAKKTLADGLYQALSAGVPASNAIEFLTVASKAAVGGVTDVKTAVDGLTSVMNAYGIEAARVSDVSDILFTVVKEGKINFEELSQNIGNIAPFAKVARVGIEDLSAMIATLVKVDKPERAMTSLRQAMVFAAKVGKPLLQVLEEFEGKSLEDLLKAGVTQKSAAGIAIMSNNMEVLRKEMALFKNTAGAANAAFKDVSAVRGWQRLWQTILSITSRVGETIDTKLQPAINRVTAAITSMGKSAAFDAFIKKVGNATQMVIKFFSVMTGGGGEAGKAFASLGDIITLSFVSGAQQAANILVRGLGAAWDAFNSKAMKGVKSFASSLWNPLLIAHKQAKFLSGVGSGKQGAVEDLFDVSGTNERRDAAIDRLGQQLTSFRPKGIPSRAAFGIGGTTAAAQAGGLIGLGKGVPNAGGAGLSGVSASTSLISTSDLATMMQTGGAAKRDTEIGELQGINTRLDKIIELQGGVE